MPIDVPIPTNQLDIEIDAPSTEIIYRQNRVRFRGDTLTLPAMFNGKISTDGPSENVNQLTASFWIQSKNDNAPRLFGDMLNMGLSVIDFDIFSLIGSTAVESPITSPSTSQNALFITARNFGASPEGTIYSGQPALGFELVNSPERVHHIILAWQNGSAGGDNHWILYVDDVEWLDEEGDLDSSMGATTFPVGSGIGGNFFGSAFSKINADLADMWITTEQFVDPRIEANRRLFSDTDGDPVDLGTRGQLPTGTIPEHFFGGDHKAADWNAGTNLGLIGNEVSPGLNWTMDGSVTDVVD